MGSPRHDAPVSARAVEVEQEFFLEQIETGTAACRTIDELVTAVCQRAVLEATGDLRAVVRDVAERTLLIPVGAP